MRGRTLSSRHHSYAWPAIIEAGVKWVIDLREKDRSSRLPDLCAISGIGYFHYPVDNDSAVIDSMIELLPQFCATIDRWDFYIACAMGLHRTDIALCTYWIFYAADKGSSAASRTITIPLCSVELGLNERLEPSDSTEDSDGSSSIITLIKLIEDLACFQRNSLLSL